MKSGILLASTFALVLFQQNQVAFRDGYAVVWKFNVRKASEKTMAATVWTNGELGGLGFPVAFGLRVRDTQSTDKPTKATVTFQVYLMDAAGRKTKVRERTVSPAWARLAIEKGYYERDFDETGKSRISEKPYAGELDTWEVIIPDALGIFVPKGGVALDRGKYLVNVVIAFSEQGHLTISDIPYEVSLPVSP